MFEKNKLWDEAVNQNKNLFRVSNYKQAICSNFDDKISDCDSR